MVRLITYNIEYCEGMSGKWYEYLKFWKTFMPPKNLDKKIVEKLKDYNPDILALVEVDIGSIRAHKDEAKFFEHKLHMNSVVEHVKYPFEGALKIFKYVPILNKQANAIIAKNKLSDVKHHLLSNGTKKVVIEASVKVPEKVTMLLAHLALGWGTRKKQMIELTSIVKNIDNPVILMGDFNTFHGEDEINALLAETHLHHKFNMNDKSLTFTEPAFHPTKRLDYVLTSKEIEVQNYQVLDFHFSDHLPLMVDFIVKK